MIKPRLLTAFIKRRLIIEGGSLLNPDSIAEDVFYLLKSKATDKEAKPNKSFFTKHVESLLRSYGERLGSIETEEMIVHEIVALFNQSCDSVFMDVDKSSFNTYADKVDEDVDNEADFMVVMGSTE